MEIKSRTNDERKIAFIVCTNNTFFMDECRFYLEHLAVPEGYNVDIVEITEAKSMTEGYNEGMNYSDAKYKIYLHQDVFIIYRDFLKDLLNIFINNPDVGMIGMVGTPHLCKDGTMWRGIRFGGFYKLDRLIESGRVRHFFPIRSGFMDVEAIDGLLMATQYDIPWRDDVFHKWDFYDVSQSFEMRRAGYRVVVPGQERNWYIHDCGASNLTNYDGERKLFLKTYEEMQGRQKETWKDLIDKNINVVKNSCFTCDPKEKENLLTILEKLRDEKQ